MDVRRKGRDCLSKIIGVLIRRERLRQNYSQEGLCRGICAVSYLSKIEQGKAETGNDILQPLLKRLGIDYETDPEFLLQAKCDVETLYEELLAGRDGMSLFRETLERVRAQRTRYLASSFLLDALLLLTFQDREFPQEATEFVSCMTSRQYALYLLLRMWYMGEDTAEELLRLAPCGFYICSVGEIHYWAGRYMEATSLLSRGYDLAAQAGDVYLMLEAQLFLGNCYSDSGQKELMLEHYRVARKLAVALGDGSAYIPLIDYNLGSTYLEWGMVEEAYALLKTVDRCDALYFHKLAIALERLGRREEALAALAQGRTAPMESPRIQPAMEQILDVVEYRLRHPNYLRDSNYVTLMQDTFRLLRRTTPSGFVRFHVPYMLEILEAERRYKEAYQLSAEFSGILNFK